MKTPITTPPELSLDWIQTDAANEDPTRIRTTDPSGDTCREVSLGNGFLAVALGAEGMGGFEHNLAPARIAGVWADDRLILPPDFSLFRYHDGHALLQRGNGTVRAYEQTLDLRYGICETRWDWESVPGRRSELISTVLPCRHDAGLLLQEMTIVAHFEGTITLEDGVDGRRCEAVDGWQSRRWGVEAPSVSADAARDHQRGGGGEIGRAGEYLAFGCQLGFQLRKFWMVARLDTDGDCETEWVPCPAGFLRRTRVSVRPGQTVRARRYVYIHEDQPGVDAARHVSGTLSGLDWDTSVAGHRSAVDKIWKNVRDEGPVRLQFLLNSARHHLLTSVRAGQPTGLACLGLTARRWRGGTLWDADTWMHPALLDLDPDLARTIPDFRFANLQMARELARKEGLEGAAYPWISTLDGREVCYFDAFRGERHVSNSVVLAAANQAEVDNDPDWKRRVLWPLAREVASQWVSRARPDDAGSRYHILNVCGPDEAAERVDDNAYTLLTAAWVIRLAIRLAGEIGETVPDHWQEVADNLKPHWDEAHDIPKEHRDYDGQTIKQADTALLVYPWKIVDDPGLASRISRYYRKRYPEHPIMMTHPIDGIIDAMTGDEDGLSKALEKMLESFHGPFLTMCESAVPALYPFCTGYGALLQMFARQHRPGVGS